MTQGDGAAVDIDPFGGDAEVMRRRQGYAGEGLVDLDQVQVGDGQRAVSPQGVTDRAGGLVQQGRIRPGDGAVAAELGEPGQAQPTWIPVMPTRSRAAAIAVPASVGAGRADREPSSLPIGVRAPATSTGCGIEVSSI
jgi:hypothetical protein